MQQNWEAGSPSNIITFPGHVQNEVIPSKPKRISNVSNQVARIANNSVFYNDLVHGSLKGKAFGNIPLYQSVIAGILYASVALGTLFFTL